MWRARPNGCGSPRRIREAATHGWMSGTVFDQEGCRWARSLLAQLSIRWIDARSHKRPSDGSGFVRLAWVINCVRYPWCYSHLRRAETGKRGVLRPSSRRSTSPPSFHAGGLAERNARYVSAPDSLHPSQATQSRYGGHIISGGTDAPERGRPATGAIAHEGVSNRHFFNLPPAPVSSGIGA